MDVLLTHGYFLSEDEQEQSVMRPYPPLGILYLSAHLKARGFSVEVFDSTFSSIDAFRETIGLGRPPVVAISANLMTRRSVVAMIRHSRKSGAWVIVGGPEPANYPREYLDAGAHVVVAGEGELTLQELLEQRRGGTLSLNRVQGIFFRDKADGIVETPARPHMANLDEQPFPDRDAIDVDRYVDVWRRHHGRGAVSLITSRGCPYTCRWCSHGVFGFTHRARSAVNVADEVEWIQQRYKPDMLWYADDVFTINPRWLSAYASELEGRGLQIPFETITREDRLTSKTISQLSEMGCFRLWIGAESGSQRILDSMQRRTSAARVVELVGELQQHGIEAGLFIMLGYDGESLEDIRETLKFLKAASPDRFLTTVSYPIKGTPFYEQVDSRILGRSDWETSSDRDLGFRGRHSDRFYREVNRWILNEMTLHSEWNKKSPNYLRIARSLAGSRWGRFQMLVAAGRGAGQQMHSGSEG